MMTLEMLKLSFEKKQLIRVLSQWIPVPTPFTQKL